MRRNLLIVASTAYVYVDPRYTYAAMKRKEANFATAVGLLKHGTP